MADKIRSVTDQRSWSPIYHDFLDVDPSILSYYDKIVFIILRRYADRESMTAFPSIKTIHDKTGMSESQIRRCIKHLEELGAISITRRKSKYNEYYSNVYTLYDFKELWEAGSNSDKKDNALTAYKKKLFEGLAKELGYDLEKVHVKNEKEPTSEPAKVTDVSPQSSISNLNYKESRNKSQDNTERYSADVIREFYEYDIMVYDHPEQREMIDTVMNILYDTLNSTKPVIRVDGQERPSMVVQAKLLKLDRDAILYAIRKYQEQTDRVKQPVAYMLTILYKAREQMELDIANQVKHDMSHPVMDQ